MGEIWDLYDENRLLLDKKHLRGIPLLKGEYHLVTDVWVINFNNEILITQRHPDKKHGLLWECTGGSAITGEDSLTSALRELYEEVGIVAKREELKLINTVRVEGRFVDTYLLKIDISLKELKLQESEVIDAKFVDFEYLEGMWREGLVVPRQRFRIYKNVLQNNIINR